jgi:hypothetical protein
MTTLTEALQLTKTLKERIAKKRERLTGHVARLSIMKDPMTEEGGQKEHVQREFQAISDLEEQLIETRRRISETNIESFLVVEKESKSICDWLNWRREVVEERKKFLDLVLKHLDRLRKKTEQDKIQLESAEDERAADFELIVNVSEQKLREELEWIETALGSLDARLSVKNATTELL